MTKYKEPPEEERMSAEAALEHVQKFLSLYKEYGLRIIGQWDFKQLTHALDAVLGNTPPKEN